jgi:hypothetical protein
MIGELIDSAKDGIDEKGIWRATEPATHRVAATMFPFPTFTVEGRIYRFPDIL